MTSTKQDLRETARTLGIRGYGSMTLDELRAKIAETLGAPEPLLGDNDHTDSLASAIAKAGPGAVATAFTKPINTKPGNIPNLSPTGKWEGKRARLRRLKTGHNDMNGAIFNWNGWRCIIPIDVDVDVAWPIYEIIKNTTGIELDIRQEEDPRDKGKVQNIKSITHYQKYPYTFKGVTPGTEHLPESPWEYTLDQYVEDFPGFTVRMWRQLCVLWELADATVGIKPGINPEEEMKIRKNAIHYLLNLPMDVDRPLREQIRDQKRLDIGMDVKAA